jgi:hypothetical protein
LAAPHFPLQRRSLLCLRRLLQRSSIRRLSNRKKRIGSRKKQETAIEKKSTELKKDRSDHSENSKRTFELKTEEPKNYSKK